MMISIVPMSFLLSCYLSESLSMPSSSPSENREPSESTASDPKAETLVKAGDECPAHEVESREMCDASLLSYFLLNVTTTN